jgi:nucleotide-binding universal stress UspA family protein
VLPPAGRRRTREDDLTADRAVRVAAVLLLEGIAEDVTRHVPEVPVSTHVLEGRPADVLADAGRTAALLVVGSRSTGGIGDVVLGSTAIELVRSAPCTVLVVPLRPGSAVYGRRGVVVGVAGAPGDQDVLSFAFSEAAARSTEVVAVHAWQHPFPGPGHLALDPFVGEPAARRREEDVLADALEGCALAAAGTPVRRIVEHGHPAAALVAASLAADLLVVGHRSRATGLLGSVTAAVVHRAACPVAVVPLRVASARTPEGLSPAARP